MARIYKRKRKTNWLIRQLRPEVAGAAFVVALLGLGMQARANLSVPHTNYAHEKAVTLAAPATPTPKPPAPTPTPPPATPVPKRVAVVTHRSAPVPVVKPAPNSSVSNLAPVSSPPASATPTPSTAPGASSSPTPTPSTPPTFAYSSSNWSGYLASAGQFTGVSGSWTVPHATGNGVSTSADATWVGIGGVTSSDLIQTGTDDTVTRSGQVSTIAFYELLPDSETPIPGMTVSEGDNMSADISNLGAAAWKISISDVTRGENFSINVTYNSTLSTAEWVEEDPSFSSGGLVPFDNFGFVSFSGATATENGAVTSLTGAGAQAIIMENNRGQAVATPSAINGSGEGFSVSGG